MGILVGLTSTTFRSVLPKDQCGGDHRDAQQKGHVAAQSGADRRLTQTGVGEYLLHQHCAETFAEEVEAVGVEAVDHHSEQQTGLRGLGRPQAQTQLHTVQCGAGYLHTHLRGRLE